MCFVISFLISGQLIRTISGIKRSGIMTLLYLAIAPTLLLVNPIANNRETA